VPRSANPLTAFLARSNEDPIKIIGVACLVALASALVVSTTSVALKPYQDAHLEAERAARMTQMLERLPGMEDILAEAGADSLVTRLVDLSDGSFVEGLDADTYDQAAAAADPASAVTIPEEADRAGLHQRAPYAPVYLLERDGTLELVLLPMSSTGYQSTIRAMLALETDLTTVAALTILEQNETPGMGARIEEPDWQAQWVGKQVSDESGAIVIEVVRGEASGPYQVDGISGATRTGNGVADMLHYWLGDHGFGPFLQRLAEDGS
jgi:Na+-transporting NADH:ubiquinone oxidoreductase subunit C